MKFSPLIVTLLCLASALRAETGADRKVVLGLVDTCATAPKTYDAEGFKPDGQVHAIFYDALPWNGKPTRVFAWIGLPAKREGKVPGMVLVHGGGGTAYKEWVQKWNAQGFAAISIAVEGQTDVDEKKEAKETTDKATARDLELLKGEWRARNIWHGGVTEASAIDGGRIVIKDRTFSKQHLSGTDEVATIVRIDATKNPKEMDLKTSSRNGKEKIEKLVYNVDDERFEYFWTSDGADRPTHFGYFGLKGPFVIKEEGRNVQGVLYQYTRAK